MNSSTPSSPLSSSLSTSHFQVSKKRKVDEKIVVRVKTEAKRGDEEPKNGGPPPDSWSWRKYGQKPITGSPYPRGYYRCSTAKGCSAKKQVERCKDDASVVIITYTSAHNHTGPDNHPKKKAQASKAHSKPTSDEEAGNNGKDENSTCNEGEVDDEEPYVVTLDNCTPCDSLDNSPMLIKHPTSTITEEGYDFYDALHDLGFSSITSFTTLL